jgi:hypothetical protein
VWLTLHVQRTDAQALADALELDVHSTGICLACLCSVSFALDAGDESGIRRATNYFAPALWAEGLALPARRALERARVAGVAYAEEAIADIERRGARSPVVHAIVRRLGRDLLEEMNLPRRADVIPLGDRR